jgi:hypothetical protein
MKVLVWNIEKFTEARLNDGQVIKGGPLSRGRKIFLPGDEVLAYMAMVFNGNGQATHVPEVIAILEVLAPKNLAHGALLPHDSPGGVGLVSLLRLIKSWTGNNDWRIVPPLKCNPPPPAAGTPWSQAEVVGVLYDSSRITFSGPNGWINNSSQARAAGLVPAIYDPLDPASPWHDAGITGATALAGQVKFYQAGGAELQFPKPGNRSPFMVDFTERHGKARTIRFGFIHTSPGFHEKGTQEFAKIREMRGDGGAVVGDPPITVFAGDFNVNAHYPVSSIVSYGPLRDQGFLMMFSSADFRSTHYYPYTDATPGPWFSYQQQQLIDNFLVRHKNPAEVAGAAYDKIVIDAAAGTPAPYATTMHFTMANLLTYSNSTQAFRYWENFWHIRKCSDHMPTLLDIL